MSRMSSLTHTRQETGRRVHTEIHRVAGDEQHRRGRSAGHISAVFNILYHQINYLHVGIFSSAITAKSAGFSQLHCARYDSFISTFFLIIEAASGGRHSSVLQGDSSPEMVGSTFIIKQTLPNESDPRRSCITARSVFVAAL